MCYWMPVVLNHTSRGATQNYIKCTNLIYRSNIKIIWYCFFRSCTWFRKYSICQLSLTPQGGSIVLRTQHLWTEPLPLLISRFFIGLLFNASRTQNIKI